MAPFGGFSAVGSSGGRGVPTNVSLSTRTATAGRYSHAFARVARLGHLAERCDVVEYPEGTAVGRDREIVAVNREIADGSRRQVQLQRLPMIAVVEGHIDAQFSSGKEQPLRSEDLHERPQESPRRNSIGDRFAS